MDQIAAAIELARMGAISGLPDLETQMARYSMRILAETLDVDPDAPVLSEQHVVAVRYLIEGPCRVVWPQGVGQGSSKERR